MQNKILSIVGSTINGITKIAPNLSGKISYHFFCYPFTSKLKDYQQAFLNKAFLFSINFHGNKIQCYKWGNGSKKILLVHGWASNSFRWKSYIEALQTDEYTIYAFDAPGNGNSQGKVLNLLIYSEILEIIIKQIGDLEALLSHSLGGFATTLLLHENKNININKVVIMGAPGEVNAFVTEFQKRMNLKDYSIIAMKNYFENKVDRKFEYFSTKNFALSLTQKALIVHDIDDADAPYNHAVMLHQNWKNSILKTTKGLGHSLKSKDLVKEVINFIEQ